MTPSGCGKDHGPQQPAGPGPAPAIGNHEPQQSDQAEQAQNDHRDAGDPLVRVGSYGVDDVSAVELSSGNEVQRGGEHAYPGGNGDRMQA